MAVPNPLTRAETIAEMRRLHQRSMRSTFMEPSARGMEFQADMDIWKSVQLEKQLDPPLTEAEKEEILT